ncbi:MAG TPA: aminoacyl-tRNA hydrolase [Clostridiales bacterium]|nr:aminoacyl-tRNA hydrolase [Clostridiales bacterium]
MLQFFRRNIPTGTPEYLIVGLGNPGGKYEFTRHNVGFMCLDTLALDLNVKINKIKFKSLTADVVLAGKRCILMKPQTFMNNSGQAVREATDFYKIEPEKIIVVFDDVSLPFAGLRLRRNGSDGGHNGVKSIIYHLKSDAFPRVKVGIGAKPHPEMQLMDWVLSSFTKEELTKLKDTAADVCKALELIVADDMEKAMMLYN